MNKILALFFASLMLSSCTWVKVTQKGEGVRLVHATRLVESCNKLGNVNTQVMSRVIIDRDMEKVAGELADLARNEAALMGGDTIIPVSEIRDGRRSFNVYRCFPVKLQ